MASNASLTLNTLEFYKFQEKNSQNPKMLCLVQNSKGLYLSTIDRKCVTCWNLFWGWLGYGPLADKCLDFNGIFNYALRFCKETELSKDSQVECCRKLFAKAVSKKYIGIGGLPTLGEKLQRKREEEAKQAEEAKKRAAEQAGKQKESKKEAEGSQQEAGEKQIENPAPMNALLTLEFGDPFAIIGNELMADVRRRELEIEIQAQYGPEQSYAWRLEPKFIQRNRKDPYYGNKYRDFRALAVVCKEFQFLIAQFFGLKYWNPKMLDQRKFGRFRRYNLISICRNKEAELIAICPSGVESGQTAMQVSSKVDFFREAIRCLPIRRGCILHAELYCHQ